MMLSKESMKWAWCGLLALTLVLGACNPDDEDDDGDTSGDVGEDVAGDVAADEGDASEDLAVDYGLDPATDLGEDAAPDASADADLEAGVDLDPDLPECGDADCPGDAGPDATGDADASGDADLSDVLIADTAQDPAIPDATADLDPGDSTREIEEGDASCPREHDVWSDLDIGDYTQIPPIDELDLSATTPAVETAYWELRWGFFDEEPEVQASTGTLCADASDTEACEAEFAALSSDVGFGEGCLPGYCFYYLAVNQGDTSFVVTDVEGILDFFGDIDTAVEAILLAKASGYDWRTTGIAAGGYYYDDAEAAWRMLVTDLVRGCDPVITDRIDLTITKSGTVTPLRSHAYLVICRACI